MTSNLKRALDSIYANPGENPGDYDEEALFAVVEEFGLPNLADGIYLEIPATVPFEFVCQLFELLAWRTDDNGASVMRAAERWLIEGTDERRMLIALHLGAYPFISEKEMVDVLSNLKSTNRQIMRRCEELVRRRTQCKAKAFNSNSEHKSAIGLKRTFLGIFKHILKSR